MLTIYDQIQKLRAELARSIVMRRFLPPLPIDSALPSRAIKASPAAGASAAPPPDSNLRSPNLALRLSGVFCFGGMEASSPLKEGGCPLVDR
jgi:hypothetical protein